VFSHGRLVFHSREHNVRPVIKLIDRKLENPLVIYDKYIGRAAALLFSLVRPKRIYTPIISVLGTQTLNQYHIPYTAKKRVSHLMNIASTGTCRWEKLSVGKKPYEFLKLVKSS